MKNFEKRVWPRRMTYFLNFGTLLISLERLNIRTRNYVCTLTVTDTKRKKLKIGETGY